MILKSLMAALTGNPSINTVEDAVRHAERQFKKAGLSFGHGSVTAFEDAVFLVLESLQPPMDNYDSCRKVVLTEEQKRAVLNNIGKRVETRKPSAYIVNRAYIQGIPFYVDERVIVPRSFIGEIMFAEHSPFLRLENVRRAVDICTGSGCLAILAAHLFPEAKVDAVELSPDAIQVARKNFAESEFTDRLTLYEGSLYDPLPKDKYDLIITNPPYVDAEAMRDLTPEYTHEPNMALTGGEDGLDLVRVLIDRAPEFLTENGVLICEIGTGKDRLEAAYPRLPFLWLDTVYSSGEVFWITRKQLLAA